MTRRTSSGLAYELAGSGPAVLLLHAGIADRTMWSPQWEAWADRYALARFDHRGFGESTDPKREYKGYEDALEVLDACGIERAALVGASLGGRMAIDLALAAPERVAGVIAVAATPSGWEHAPDLVELFEAVEEAYVRDGVDAANEVELGIWVDGTRAPGEVEGGVRSVIAALNRDALAREAERERAGTAFEPGELDPPALGRLGELAAPLLAITGACDQPSVNAGVRELARRAPGARHLEIEASAHLPSLERPEAFARAALPFLERIA